MKLRIALLVAQVSAGVWAQDFDPRSFGAAGDGVAKDTVALQRTIDAAGEKGGRVVIGGGTFRTGSLFLRSGVEMHLAADGRLLGSDDPADYVRLPSLKHADPAKMPRNDGAALITADECHGISFTGTGVIDCNGLAFVEEKPDPSRSGWWYWLSLRWAWDRDPEWDWTGWRYRRRADRVPPPRVVMMLGCSNVTVRDITMTNQPAGWSFWVNDCDRVTFSNVKIRADVRYPNNDGVHINASRDVSVTDCEIETGDDSIVVRANCTPLKTPKPCERVRVENCRLRSFANAIRLGWVNDGTIRDVTFRNLTIHDSATGVGVVLPPSTWGPSDVGCEATRIEKILFENVTMDRIYAHPLLCIVYDEEGAPRVAAIRDFTFRNVRVRALEFPYVRGRADAHFRDFRFINCRFDKVSEAAFPEARWDRQGAAAWDRHLESVFECADGFTCERTTFNSPAATPGEVIAKYVEAGRIAGAVSVLSDPEGHVTYEPVGWANVEKRIPMATNTLFAIFSMTKTFAGVAVMCGIDEGKISLDDRISKFLPEFASMKKADGSAPKRELTIRDVLSHTDGMRCEYGHIGCDIPLREQARWFARHTFTEEPGETFQYGTMRFSVAAAALEVATGVPYETYLKTRVFDPLGMVDTTFTPSAEQLTRLVTAYTTDDGPLRAANDHCARQLVFPKKNKVHPAAGAGLYSTPADMIRFSQMLAHHGTWRGKTIVSRATFDRTIAIKQTAADIVQPYSCGAWIYGDWIGHEGAMRTDERANLRTGHSRVFFIQTENRAGSAFFQLKRDWRAACDALQDTLPTAFGN